MGFILVIHVIVCVLLVICVLMQAGRGGGLAESFSSAESMFGTQTNKFMVRLTTVFAIIFLTTSLILAVNSSKRDKSLMANDKLLPKQTATVPAAPKEAEATVVVEDPKPLVEEVTPQAKAEEKIAPAPVVNAVQ